MSTVRGTRLRPNSELGWTMLQWLAVLVLGHEAQAKRAALTVAHAVMVEQARARFRPPPVVLGVDLAAGHSLTPAQVEALAASGQVVTETQPPPELFKVPPEAIVMPGMAPLDKTVLRVTREYAEAMGLDPDQLERV